MNSITIIYLLALLPFTVCGQQRETQSSVSEQQLENITETNEAVPEDDSYLQQLDYFKKHPLNLNSADADQLSALNIFTGLQIQQFLLYRKLLGKLVSLYELQAIPGWDLAIIKKLLPFISIADDKNIAEKLMERWKGGDNVFLARYARSVEKAKGYDIPATPGANYYLGNRDKYFLRYRYNYKNLLQWGLLADKDAGEQFFSGSQRLGFDFYSFHFFARKLGIIKSLAIGDFTVNFGQGLIQWQSLAFKKNADAMSIKRQSATLRPYNSAGEYNFHRGLGITLQKGKWETTLFASLKKISANINADSVIDDGIVSSFLTGGYHRTASENAKRNSLQQIAIGGNLQYRWGKWQVGANAVYYHFSKPVEKAQVAYNLFALQGKSLLNTSVDYSYTWRNIHLFGEFAADAEFNKAILNGALISVDAKADISILYRKIDRDYNSVNANAFTENSFPINENGFYTGVSVRPVNKLRVDAYADIFQFPWLKYKVDAPSSGKDFFVQVTYSPNKQTEVYARYKNETKMINRSGSFSTGIVEPVIKKDLRLQTSISASREFTFRNRVEVLWYKDNAQPAGEGFLGYVEGSYKPSFLQWAANLRLQYFETSGYNQRIYAYETDLAYSFSIPFFYDKGFRYYLNFSWDAGKLINRKQKAKTGLDVGLKWAQTIYAGKNKIGSGLDEVNGQLDSEIKLQLILKR